MQLRYMNKILRFGVTYYWGKCLVARSMDVIYCSVYCFIQLYEVYKIVT